MKEFEYADGYVDEREIMIAIASMIIAVEVLSLPKDLTEVTKFGDGWVSIVIGGVLVIILTWLAANLASKFPQKTFLHYTTSLATKPIAIVLTVIYSIYSMLGGAYQVRKIADVSKEFIFEHTPSAIISFAFFLVVIYAVSGSTVSLLRLNMMFLPIILFISIIIFLFNIPLYSVDNMLPMFQTSIDGYYKGFKKSTISFDGFGIVLFYVAFVKKPKKVAVKAAFGVVIPVVLYLLLFMSTISVFGHQVTNNLLYPGIELAKTVEMPGGFFERFESIFFVIWIMALFNTTAMALDISVIALRSIFKKIHRMHMILIVAPILYLMSMIPQNLMQVNMLGYYLGLSGFFYSAAVISLLTILAKLRGVGHDE